jgi:DNA-directed RNA polymerase subunit M/transcription elongation factor TFIIS
MPKQQKLFDDEEFSDDESAVGDLSDDESPTLSALTDFLACPRCESENIDMNGMTRAAYMRRTRPYICKDCGHSFTEDESQAAFE